MRTMIVAFALIIVGITLTNCELVMKVVQGNAGDESAGQVEAVEQGATEPAPASD